MTPTTETWLPVVGYEGLYEVSDLGRVRSLDRTTTFVDGRRKTFLGRVLTPQLNRHQRWMATLTRPGCPSKFVQIHPLVLAAFVGPRPPGLVACHNNGDSTDNRLANLRWDTPTENQFDRIRHGRNDRANQTHCKRGHQLSAPNLYPDRKHPTRRYCKSCQLARVTIYRTAKHGKKHDIQELSDAYYRKVLEEIQCP